MYSRGIHSPFPGSGHRTDSSFRLPSDKQRMVIIAYSEPEGYATRYTGWLSWLASNYRKEGLTWQEANKKAYEEIYAEYAN